MKRIEIQLSGPFEEVLATLLTLPGTDTEAEEIRLPRTADSGVRQNGNCDAEVKEAFRSLYEAANGRQVKTQVGFIAIAPPIAGFLKDKPYYVATQYEFFLEAFARILLEGAPAREHRTNGAGTRGSKLVGSRGGIDVARITRGEETEAFSSQQRQDRRQPTLTRP